MFPQIAKKKKRDFEVKAEVFKQWQEAAKDLDIRSKLAIRKIPNQLLHDFSKVCRIKSIPEFYANYFLTHTYKQPPEQLPTLFSQEIQNLLTHRSHFHKINSILKDRELIIQKIKGSLLLVEGFILMSQGKSVPLETKGSIQELVKNCQSLQQLKELEKVQVQELAHNMVKSRGSNVNLIREVVSWRDHFERLNNHEVNTTKKLKIIYPHQAINCLLLPLYDRQFLKTSVLRHQITFSKDEFDPFFVKLSKNKKGGQMQNYLLQILKADTVDYQNYIHLLQSEIPKDEAQELREKQLDEQERLRQIEQKAKQEKLKEAQQKQRSMKLQRYGEKKGRAESYNSLRNFRSKKDEQVIIKRENSIKSSVGDRSKRKIINIDNLLNAKTKLGKDKQQLDKDEARIIGVYKKVGNKVAKNQSGIYAQSNEQMLHQKKALEKQMKQQKNEKEKIKKLLKQTQKKALIETKQFEQKLKRYEQQVSNLRSKIDEAKRPKRGRSGENSKSPVQSKKSVASLYGSMVKDTNQVSSLSLLQSKLQQETKVRKYLQQQIKELGNQKIKLEKFVEKSHNRASKQNQSYIRKIEKYEEVISRLKGESQQNKSLIRNLQSSKIIEDKEASESIRMYTIKQKEEEFKKKIEEKIEMRENRKKLKQSRVQQKSKNKIEQLQLDRSLSKLQKSALNRSGNDLQIVKTKQTIQIVFQPKGKRKGKAEVSSKQLIEAESKLARLERQRQLLQRKLQMSEIGKQDKNKQLQSKIQEKQQRVDYYKGQAQKEKDRNSLLEQNIRQIRKSITNQYEVKLNKERIRFERERQELLKTIEKEKTEKHFKDKFLEQQMKLLKEMEKNQNQLISMLQREKKEKVEKEKVLAQQLQEKEELRNLIEIEEIKKNIEREVRKQLLESDNSDEEDVILRDRKAQIEIEIENLRANKDQQLNDLDQQNEKLKQLISRIKGQENKLLLVIKENIQIQSDSEEEIKPQTTAGLIGKTEEKVHHQKLTINNEELVKQLENKSLLQLKGQEKLRKSYNQISSSSFYKDKEKVQNLVEFYLRSPHQYPGQKDIILKPLQKKKMIQSLQHNTKLVQKFQQQLFSLKDLPSYVPSLHNDTINNHLLNLRQVYQDYEADSLRRELFPPISQPEVYNEHQLSVQSEQLPILTLNDEVQAHHKKYSPKKSESKKNFLAINRVRLMILQQDKKKKERELMQQESKKKMAREHFEQNRIKREEKIRRKKEIQQMERAKKMQAYEDEKKADKKKQQPKQKSIAKRQHKIASKAQKKNGKNKSQHAKSDLSRSSSRSIDKKHLIKAKHLVQSKQVSGSQDEKQISLDSDIQTAKEETASKAGKQGKGQPNAKIEAIKEQQLEQSIDNRQIQEEKATKQAQEEKAERQMLKEQIKSLQSEIREYISRQEQFEVYQQFIKQQEIQGFIDKIMELSTPQLVKLNSNNTLKKDLELYSTFTVLVAKNHKNIEVGIGLFHKQYQQGEYICDYILAHQMQHFLNLIFNFSKFIYLSDPASHKIEFLFDLSFVQDQKTLTHFVEFEKKCKRLGEVYLKAKNSKQRKYVLKKSLFLEIDEVKIEKDFGVKVDLKLLRFDSLMRQVDKGFPNGGNANYSSVNLLFAYYLSKQSEELNKFRAKAENELNYRQLLVTALLLQKKELQLKNVTISTVQKKSLFKQISHLKQCFDLAEAHQLCKSQLLLEQKLSMVVKRCVLQVAHQQINYLLIKPNQAVTRIQSSNSSETGLFLNLFPKYKTLIIQAQEFLTMSKANPDLSAFFYIKHFIKNIVDVKKQTYERVYLPEVQEETSYYLKDISAKVGGTALFEERMKLGWRGCLGNSVMFVPSHRDLVVQKPFILALLSGAVERTVEGTPVFVKLII